MAVVRGLLSKPILISHFWGLRGFGIFGNVQASEHEAIVVTAWARVRLLERLGVRMRMTMEEKATVERNPESKFRFTL